MSYESIVRSPREPDLWTSQTEKLMSLMWLNAHELALLHTRYQALTRKDKNVMRSKPAAHARDCSDVHMIQREER